MKIKISIYYHTHWGQSLCISGSVPELGSWDESFAFSMNYDCQGLWMAELEVDDDYTSIEYRFLVKENGEILRREWGDAHVVIMDKTKRFEITNMWQDTPPQQFLYTSGFTDSFFYHQPTTRIHYYNRTILLLADCPYVERNQELILLGETSYLGVWDTQKALHFVPIAHGKWCLAIDGTQIHGSTEYKLAIYDTCRHEVVHWETGDNRILEPLPQQELNVVKAETVIYGHEPMYWRASGVAIPVFALRSHDSFGIGDFNDLKRMIDWSVKAKQKVIQILPVNDTTSTHTWTDSYPYNAISSYALHPLYLGLKNYPLRDGNAYRRYRDEAFRLNELETLDYEAVTKYKMTYLYDYYCETGKFILSEFEYHTFYSDNEDWLFPYACFCYLRDKYKTAEIVQWDDYKVYDKIRLKTLIENDASAKNAVSFIFFTQFLLHKQLLEAKEYAHANNVILKGDIPIGINRNSVEAWIEPHLFNLDSQTGAPPDDFSINGQNWTFPTYNWDEMEKDGYLWWKKRFRKMYDYFDAYRIDHILGFFRIWEIPLHSVQGLLGYFSPALPLTVTEIEQSGLTFDEYRMTTAYIARHNIEVLFGAYAQEVTEKYLHNTGSDLFELNEEYNTQRKIESVLGQSDDEKAQFIRNGLFEVCNEVLFVRDKKEPDKFHPRISAQYSFTYKDLNDSAKSAFNRLYDDFFYHRHNQFWYNEAMKKLPALIKATPMLVCGEDLGMIPDCVPEVMEELQILSLEVERMPKQLGLMFGNTSQLPYLSVCTTSTHDMNPIRAWWREDREVTQNYYNNVLRREGIAPDQCTSDICWQILNNHLLSPSMLCILPLQDWLSFWDDLRKPDADTERINIPSVARHYWNYRMHLWLEELIDAHDFNGTLSAMVVKTQRD